MDFDVNVLLWLGLNGKMDSQAAIWTIVWLRVGSHLFHFKCLAHFSPLPASHPLYFPAKLARARWEWKPGSSYILSIFFYICSFGSVLSLMLAVRSCGSSCNGGVNERGQTFWTIGLWNSWIKHIRITLLWCNQGWLTAGEQEVMDLNSYNSHQWTQLASGKSELWKHLTKPW